MTSRHIPITIIGAGLAGLSTAYFLEKAGCANYALFEREPSAGGLCASSVMDGFTFDKDGHVLHFRAPEIKNLLFDLIPDGFTPHTRSSWIYSKEAFTPYPFQANTYGLPTPVIKECLLGLLEARRTVYPAAYWENATFDAWIYAMFGEGYARHFMLPYNEKFWTVHPRELTCEWLDGFVPVPSVRESVEGALEPSTKEFGYNAHFWYPRAGGMQALINAFCDQVKPVHFQHEVAAIDSGRKQVVFTNGEVITYDLLISTVPLPRFVKMTSPNNDLLHYTRDLKYTSIYNVNLGIDRVLLPDKHWVYFPESECSFFRVGCYSNFSDKVVPEGCSSLYVEVSYSDERPLDRRTIDARIKKDLIKTGIVAEEDSILAQEVNDITYAYARYDRHRAPAVTALRDHFEQRDIFMAGRYAQWEYLSMEDVIIAARSAAQRIEGCLARL